MKKILIVTGGYIPAVNYGGPVVSLSNICKLLHSDFDFYVLTSDHDLKSSKRFPNINESWNDLKTAKVKYLRDQEVTYFNIKNTVDEISPDMIYLNSFFSAKFALPIFRLCQKTKIPLLIAPRGEFNKNVFKKKYKKVPYTIMFKMFYLNESVYFHATTDDEVESFMKVFSLNRERIVNLKNISMVTPREYPAEIFHRDPLKIIFLARIHENKNLLYAIKVLSKLDINIVFNIYGNIEDHLYWERCRNEIGNLKSNIQVNYNGLAKRDEIGDLFNNHHVFLFPTVSENFGHSIAESLMSECPVVISDNTPWNWVESKECGYVVSLENEQGFIDAINKIYNMNDLDYLKMRRKCRIEANEFLSIDEMRIEYKNAFNKIIAKHETLGSQRF